MGSAAALDLLKRSEPTSASGFNHLYRASGPAGLVMAAPIVSGTRKAGVIGVIDAFASDTLETFHVTAVAPLSKGATHGAAVTDILLTELARGYGASPGALLLDNVVSSTGAEPAADVAALVVSLDHMATAHARVVNISLTGPDNPVLAVATRRAVEAGEVIIAAAGNGGPAAPPAYPAAYPGVIAVAALDASLRPWAYSARGPQVYVAALGVRSMDTPSPDADIGTSFAAPRVAAFVAAGLAKKPKASATALLEASAADAGAPGRDPIYGVGIVASKADQRTLTLATAGGSTQLSANR
jgi:hypothetical protein